MEITLIPKTRAGKNKLADDSRHAIGTWHGTYRVVETRDNVQFASGIRGPWHLLTPTCELDIPALWRWVHGTRDDNFTVQPNG